MSISFIITTFNIKPYILQCLESLRPCLRPGDQVILVDDGSTDGTDLVIREFIAKGGFGRDIKWTPVWLGSNTIGGVGIAGNIGLNHVTCETVFFVDGDDYLIPSEFLLARDDYEISRADIHFTDYLEFDQKANNTKLPADHRKWDALKRPMSKEETRLAAIDLIAVPWRKFYRTGFLREHRIRFPEGDFFFEDNPFHWKVCLAAETIGFSRRIICHHRINRPGQTMASTGKELCAFFTHFQTILGYLPPRRDDLRLQAARWLLGNMSWHIARLRPAAFSEYATRAHEALQKIGDSDWNALARDYSVTSLWHYADPLRRGRIWDVVEAWKAEDDRRALRALAEDVQRVKTRLDDMDRQVKVTCEAVEARRAIDEFDAVRRLRAGTGPS